MTKRIKSVFHLLKALATDQRIPRSVRWLIGVSLAIKTVPVPDFGIDEIGLLLVFLLLATVYRNDVAAIRAVGFEPGESGDSRVRRRTRSRLTPAAVAPPEGPDPRRCQL